MRIIFPLIICFLLAGAWSMESMKPADFRREIDQWYSVKLDSLKMELDRLTWLLENKQDKEALKSQFLKARIAFKKLAVITDYFNVYQTKLWNGPAIPRIEDDSPHRIIMPHGFQKLEEILWSDGEPATDDIRQEIKFISGVIESLENEPDRINKFKNPELWDAFYQTFIRLSSLGISGFDSPVALLSLQEADATLQGLDELTDIFAPALCCDRAVLLRELKSKIAAARSFLIVSKNFNEFDRLKFLREFINPLCKRYRFVASDLGYNLSSGRRSLADSAGSIFEAGALDIDFYSPNQRYQLNGERIALGKKLFYDNRLSGTQTRSCASCHQPAKAFTDGLPKAIALDGITNVSRNTPTLWNAAFQTKQFYDSRQTMLEFQVSDVIHNVKEMKGKLDLIATNMGTDTGYVYLFKNAYPTEAIPVNAFTISNAISSYIRSLNSFHSKFDRYIRKETETFTKSEKNGFNIFMGKAKCGTCHFVPLFNGLTPPSFTESESEVLGVPASTALPAKLDSDSGKYLFSHSVVHLFSFKTPTLRNIEMTSPYMHNGIYKTLEEVVDFYNEGGGAGLGIAPANQTLPAEKLGLTKKEKKDLILFLKTLNDTSQVLSDSRNFQN